MGIQQSLSDFLKPVMHLVDPDTKSD